MKKLYQRLASHLISACFLILVAGCNDEVSFSSIRQFERFLSAPDNPLRRKITKNGVKMELQYMPTDALVFDRYRELEDIVGLREIDGAKEDEKLEQIRREKDVYAQSIYFRCTIAYQDRTRDIVYDKLSSRQLEYSNWLQKLLFHFAEYVELSSSEMEGLPLSLYHMDRSFGLHKERVLLLIFPRMVDGKDLLDQEKLTITIKEFGLGTGSIKFIFNHPMKNYKLRKKT